MSSSGGNFETIPIRGDGNCLFRTVCAGLAPEFLWNEEAVRRKIYTVNTLDDSGVVVLATHTTYVNILILTLRRVVAGMIACTDTFWKACPSAPDLSSLLRDEEELVLYATGVAAWWNGENGMAGFRNSLVQPDDTNLFLRSRLFGQTWREVMMQDQPGDVLYRMNRDRTRQFTTIDPQTFCELMAPESIDDDMLWGGIYEMLALVEYFSATVFQVTVDPRNDTKHIQVYTPSSSLSRTNPFIFVRNIHTLHYELLMLPLDISFSEWVATDAPPEVQQSFPLVTRTPSIAASSNGLPRNLAAWARFRDMFAVRDLQQEIRNLRIHTPASASIKS